MHFLATCLLVCTSAAVVAEVPLARSVAHDGVAPAAQDGARPGPKHAPIELQEALVIGRVGRAGRAALHTDAIEALIVAGRWTPPRDGEDVVLPDGQTQSWKRVRVEDGRLTDAALRGGYACWSVVSDRERVMVLDASGHGMVYVNGLPRAGDPYRTGFVRLPVLLTAGTNVFLFQCSRGELSARLVEPEGPLYFDPADATLPDLIRGENELRYGAVVLVNARNEPLLGAVLNVSPGELFVPARVPTIPPLGTRKIEIPITAPVPPSGDTLEVEVSVWSGASPPVLLAQTKFELRIRDPREKHQRTFRSGIDGSVQYYAVTPAHPPEENTAPPALVLTLHGASVEASGQANAYDHKSWAHIVAPTNRRPYGFDWEDWGRIDALEVLTIAQEEFVTDPQRTYLTGHSMGGHGTWQVGVQAPDRFAAIAPSAGWISFWSYAGAPDYAESEGAEAMLRRARAPSDTLALSRNYLHYGVYVLHGDADDNVPVEQARTMREHLGKYHPDFAYYERPGAGHWWGNQCVDWPPLLDFLQNHVRPPAQSRRHVEFWTANPAVSSTSGWVTVEAQRQALVPSKVDVRFEPETRRFTGTTENVARLALDLAMLSEPPTNAEGGAAAEGPPLPPGASVTVELDAQTGAQALKDVPWPTDGRIRLELGGSGWQVAGSPDASEKGPHRYGPFKEAFGNHMMFVYGTGGTPEENAWALAKARYDAETFWYRGNGSVSVVPDGDFDAELEPDRNVILYGHREMNSAWQRVVADGPVDVRAGSVRLGEREWTGDDLACLFIYPRAGSERAAVGTVCGSGLPGARLTDRMPYFVSGVAYPDCIVLGPEALSADGVAGVRAAGFFGMDWSVTKGQFAWGE